MISAVAETSGASNDESKISIINFLYLRKSQENGNFGQKLIF